MPRRKSEQDNPVVAEVRRWRAKVFKKAGGTLNGLISLLDQPTDARKAMKLPSKHRASRAGGAQSSRRKSA